jgi:Macrocin-O-methyltransferase (TylF)
MADAGDRILPREPEHEAAVRRDLAALLAATPIPQAEIAGNLSLYLHGKTLRDVLAMDLLYRKIRDVPGAIFEFGVHRGRHLATLTTLRAHHEPYNPHRRIVGFDTFTGFPDVSDKDPAPSAVPGRFAVARQYPDHLREVLAVHERLEPLAHIQRTLVVDGDVRETLPRYLEDNPHTVIALAYLDLDLYEPTRAVIEQIIPYLTKGSIIAFDELAHAKWPGETSALRDTLGTSASRLRLLPGHATPAYLTWEG